MEIFNIKNKLDYLKEVVSLTMKEWGSSKNNEEFEQKLHTKINKIMNDIDKKDFCILILLDNEKLLGFISIFPNDGEERAELTPWYATMYVKEEYRNQGYSKLLNDAILKEAKSLGFEKIYLKSDLINYYEKFGAKYMETLKNGESLYYIDL